MNYEKIELLIQIVEFASICSVISSTVNQNIKSLLKWNSTLFAILSAFISILIGTTMAILFSDFEFVYALFNGVIVFAGAKIIYEQLNKQGIVKSVQDHNNKNKIEIPIENKIKFN